MSIKERISDSEATETLLEKLRLWQIVFGALFGFISAFTPSVVKYVDYHWINPPPVEIECGGQLTITSPPHNSIVYGKEVDVTGVVDPTGPCENLFLILSTVEGHNHFITDTVTINPDGTWDAKADLDFVPYNTTARIQARLCGKSDAYLPESCLPSLPNEGIRSKTITIMRKEKNKPSMGFGQPNTVQIPSRYPRLIGPAKQSQLQISEFSPNLLSGHVSGLKYPEKFKIVVYGKDTSFGWIKMPYPGNKEGYGWAPIAHDGGWAITMKERFAQEQNFISNYVVLLMERSATSPDRVDDLKKLNYKIKQEVH